jgi:hypothetical protein
MTNFTDMIKTAISENVDLITAGAGLPLDLPSFLTKDSVTKLVPIVSSARATKIICEKWKANYDYLPDAVKQLTRACSISRRQAYRYFRQAKIARGLLPVPEVKRVFTVKLTVSLIGKVRQRSRREGNTVPLHDNHDGHIRAYIDICCSG